MPKLVQTELLCPECGNKALIFRRISRQKKYMHRKKLYCFVCKKETNHIEVRCLEALLAELYFKDNLSEDEQKVIQLVKKRRGLNDR